MLLVLVLRRLEIMAAMVETAVSRNLIFLAVSVFVLTAVLVVAAEKAVLLLLAEAVVVLLMLHPVRHLRLVAVLAAREQQGVPQQMAIMAALAVVELQAVLLAV